MDTPYDLAVVNPWAPPARPAKRPLSGFIPVGPSAFTVIPPPGNPVGVFRSVIQKIYENTPLTAILPPASSAPPPLQPPTATLTSSSFAGLQGSTSAQPTWNWTYGGGAATSRTWTVLSGVTPPATNVVDTGTTAITTYTYAGPTVEHSVYRMTVDVGNSAGTGGFSNELANNGSAVIAYVSQTIGFGTAAAPTFTVTSSSALPYQLGFFVYVSTTTTDPATPPPGPGWQLATGGTIVAPSGTNTYTFPGATIVGRFYRFVANAFNPSPPGTIYASATSPVSLLCLSATPVATLLSFGFNGVQGTTNAQPSWNWTFNNGAPPTAQTWTVRSGSTNPTTVLATGTSLINSYTWTGATVQDFLYRMTVTVSNAAGSGVGFVNTNPNLGNGTLTYISQTINSGTLAAPAITVSSSSSFPTRLFYRLFQSTSAVDPGTQPPGTGWQQLNIGLATQTPSGTNTYTFNGTTVVGRYYRYAVSLQGAASPFATYVVVYSPTSLLVTSQSIVATGGVITDANGFRTHTFTSPGTFTLVSPATAPLSLMVLGGGGGGGFTNCAGGGGAGVLEGVLNTNYAAGAYPVTVGLGGNGGSAATGPATNGGDSSFGSLVALGGGYGGTIAQPYNGGNGGCGGGGSYAYGLKGTGAPNGTEGGDGSVLNQEPNSGGGGGGLLNQGGRANTTTANSGGAGGDGFNASIGGVAYAIGGGGGGGSDGDAGIGGFGGGGGGGNPGTSLGSGGDGAPNPGGGGGGGGGGFPATSGGNGGSGVVRVAYAL